jgi:hypothetical protein
MIRFDFTLRNPFKVGGSGSEQRDYIEYDRKITTNKAIEVQFTKWKADRIFSCSLDTMWIGTDHGGIGFDIEVLGYFFAAKLYDVRHWDYKNHCWEVYDEDEQ